MLLAIDIGNTDTVVGIYDDGTLTEHFRVASALNLTIDEAGLFVSSLFHHHIKADISQAKRVAICSVVPHLTDIYRRMTVKYFKVEPLIITSKVKLPVKIDYPKPEEIGADRLANAAAGFARLGSGLIVVDIGTATTFDIVSDAGAYIGGVIAPGPRTAGINLARKAAQLFEVENAKPDRVIGKSTGGAIMSGLYYGTIGLIDTIVDNIYKELDQKLPVIATGGAAETYLVDSKHIKENVPTLTLDGIKIIADINID
ncbi:MAG: type III pantothenate kinase [Candidatus Zixiibacteriota bacterium]